VANVGIRASRSLPQRGPAPGFRFFVYAILSVALMYLDRTSGWLELVRYGLQAAAYPLQLAVSSPAAAWRWTSEIFESRARLQQENAALRRELRELELRTARLAALERENTELRGLRAALPPVAEKWLPGEVINVESSSLRQRLVINRGARHGVFKGQAVMARAGLLGQTLRVGPWSSEVILVTDPEHAVPVQDVRNGLRTLAVGSGEPDVLLLPYLPIQADIQVGDLLVTSGLGGVFPAGFPVAEVISVDRGSGSPLARVRARPLAALDRDREVMFVWFHEAHPAAPAVETPDATAANSPGFAPIANPSPARLPAPPPDPSASPRSTEPGAARPPDSAAARPRGAPAEAPR
jgi:rod shape-determining protein MreC